MKRVIALMLAMALIISGYALPKGTSFAESKRVDSDYVKASVMDVGKKVKANWSRLGQVWPGLDYEKNKLLVIDLDEKENKKRGWVVGINGVFELKSAELKTLEVPSTLGYNAIQYKGQKAVVISVEASKLMEINQMMINEKSLSNNYIYTVGTHEMVHFYYQPKLKHSIVTESRAAVYPISEKPRVYRKMVMLKLMNAYEAKTGKQADQYLSEAKYWYEKWQTEFKQESDSIYRTDIMEGQARYIEYMAENKQLNVITPINFNLIKNKTYSAADSESYELGFLSGLLLDKYNPKWKATYFSNEVRPVEILLKCYKAKENLLDEKTQRLYKQEIDQTNILLAKQMVDIEKSEKDISIPYLRVNTDAVVGSYMLENNVLFNNKDVYMGMVFNAKTQVSQVSINGLSVFELPSAEGESYYYMPLTMPYKIENDKIFIQTKNLNVSATVDLAKDTTGRAIYTAR